MAAAVTKALAAVKDPASGQDVVAAVAAEVARVAVAPTLMMRSGRRRKRFAAYCPAAARAAASFSP